MVVQVRGSIFEQARTAKLHKRPVAEHGIVASGSDLDPSGQGASVACTHAARCTTLTVQQLAGRYWTCRSGFRRPARARLLHTRPATMAQVRASCDIAVLQQAQADHAPLGHRGTREARAIQRVGCTEAVCACRVFVTGQGPSARYAHTLALVANRFIVAMGGNDGRNTLADAWSLDTSEKPYQWRKVSAQGINPPARCGITMARVASLSLCCELMCPLCPLLSHGQ